MRQEDLVTTLREVVHPLHEVVDLLAPIKVGLLIHNEKLTQEEVALHLATKEDEAAIIQVGQGIRMITDTTREGLIEVEAQDQIVDLAELIIVETQEVIGQVVGLTTEAAQVVADLADLTTEATLVEADQVDLTIVEALEATEATDQVVAVDLGLQEATDQVEVADQDRLEVATGAVAVAQDLLEVTDLVEEAEAAVDQDLAEVLEAADQDLAAVEVVEETNDLLITQTQKTTRNEKVIVCTCHLSDGLRIVRSIWLL